jgi:hypothetical protein
MPPKKIINTGLTVRMSAQYLRPWALKSGLGLSSIESDSVIYLIAVWLSSDHLTPLSLRIFLYFNSTFEV